MKKLLSTFACMVLLSLVSSAQGVSELFKDNSEMKNLFVSPLGIDGVMENPDFDSLVSEVKSRGLDCKSLDLGEYGKILNIMPKDIAIGGVCIDRMMMVVNKDFNGLIYQSEPSDNYKDMCSSLDKSLSGFAKMVDNAGSGTLQFNVYMLNDDYGIAVGAMDNTRTAMAFMMDMKNLKSFMNIAGAM